LFGKAGMAKGVMFVPPYPIKPRSTQIEEDLSGSLPAAM
jgi:hypothetical protein